MANLTAAQYADGLRQIADWYEQHPDAFVPHTPTISIYTTRTKSDIVAMARALGHCQKRVSGDLFYVSRGFGALTLEFVARQSQVCESRVVGTRMNPGWPAREPYEEEILEWECKPLLGELP